MLIDHINLNTLRIFECVYRTKSMTQAAEELHLTQSGVSQHIKHLEEVLETKLFDRIKQRLIPTRSAKMLFDKCSVSLYQIEQSLSEIKDSEQYLKGTVNIGAPIEFGNNLVLPKLADLAKKNPKIDFHLIYGHAVEMNAKLISGDLDIAFVDEHEMDSQITIQKVYEEELHLCATPAYVEAKGPVSDEKKYFESLDYIAYIKDDPILKKWFQHHYHFQRLALPVKASLMDVKGVATMILNSMGVGVLPQHVIARFESEGRRLYRFREAHKPLNNPISVAYLDKRVQSPIIATVMKPLIESFHVP